MSEQTRHLPCDVVQKVTALHENVLFCWCVISPEYLPGRYLGLVIANHPYPLRIDHYVFPDDMAAEAEAARLNGMLGIDQRLAQTIIRSKDVDFPPKIGDRALIDDISRIVCPTSTALAGTSR